jgi:anti-sigma factor RsiW
MTRSKAKSKLPRELVLFCLCGVSELGRPFDKHIDNDELNALVPWSAETGQELHGLSPEAVREAERHTQSCVDCSKKVAKYRQLLGRFSNVAVSGAAPPGDDCPKDIDWHEVAAGLWPESKARQLIMHAALCDHCGSLLRTATSLDQTPTPQEEKLMAEMKAPSQPDLVPRPGRPSARRWPYMRWLVPAVALILTVAALGTWWPSSPRPLSGAKFAEFAVSIHRQHAQGNLALDVHSDSQQMLNEWFRAKSPFSLALPASPAAPGEDRPYRLEGARLVQVIGKPAVYIAYQMQAGPAGLVVTLDSVAVAAGGVQVDYKKVTFNYCMVERYKVVTWSLHARTYALVSEEGNNTQRSCMVCHSAMRDRDLSQTPTPLRAQPVLQ